jgi:hypothetical protein
VSTDVKQLAELRAALSLGLSLVDRSDLVPILVPAAFIQAGEWPGPHEPSGVPGVCLTWAVLTPAQTMRYVDRAMAEYWESNGIPWRTEALGNLRARSRGEVWTHEFRREDGTPFGVAMMHADGVGPSRLLLHEALQELFPEEYLIALPEMSCGLALSRKATGAESSQLRELADTCFRNGTRPLVRGFHEVHRFTAEAGQ